MTPTPENLAKPDLNAIAGALASQICQKAVVFGEHSPQKMVELIVPVLLKVYNEGKRNADLT